MLLLGLRRSTAYRERAALEYKYIAKTVKVKIKMAIEVKTPR